MRLALLIFLLTLCELCSAFQQPNISAFVYHRFGDDSFPSTNIDLNKFEEQLKFLRDNDYKVLNMSQALDQLEDLEESAKVAVITIDDAFNSFYANGWPLLKAYGFSATLYINTETVGSSAYMGWDEIKEVQDQGIEIGNHSHAHPYFLNDFKETEFIEDIKLSHEAFKNGMNSVPKTYAYPYGEWNQRMADILDSMGYSSAVAQNSGVIYKESSRFHIPRFPMSNDFADMNAFKEKLNVNALEVEEVKVYESGSFGSTKQPTIILSFNEADYSIENLQVFIQGNMANKSVTIGKGGLAKLTISPKSPLNRRRTLFTVTVPNRKGKWSWFSYSWVITSYQE